jgi:hypothetical protein
MTYSQEYEVTWDEFDHLCVTLSSKLRSFDPDVIVGIARGGLPPAVRISHILPRRPLGTIAIWKYRAEPWPQHQEEVIVEGIALPSSQVRRVLIIDDLISLGVTMSRAIAIVKNRYGSRTEVKTGSLFARGFVRPRSGPLSSHVSVRKLSGSTWVGWPWETSSHP